MTRLIKFILKAIAKAVFSCTVLLVALITVLILWPIVTTIEAFESYNYRKIRKQRLAKAREERK